MLMKIMAVDYGDVRTGLAVCDRTEFLASPIGTIEERNAQILAMKIAHMAEQYEVGRNSGRASQKYERINGAKS